MIRCGSRCVKLDGGGGRAGRGLGARGCLSSRCLARAPTPKSAEIFSAGGRAGDGLIRSVCKPEESHEWRVSA